MPRPPKLSQPVLATRGAVYSPHTAIVQQLDGETYPSTSATPGASR